MKKNNKANEVINAVINAMFTGILIGAVLSLPIVFLAIEFGMSLLLCMLVPMAFFGTVLPLSTVSMWVFGNGCVSRPQV